MTSVTLRVYDLSRGMARQLSMPLLGKQIDGIWHTGVLVFGKVYFFGGGIQVMEPEMVVMRYAMEPVQTVHLGVTNKSQAQFETFLRSISPRFTAATYDLLRHNCNNFSNELAMFLLGDGIPQHILDLPNEALSTPLGAMLRPAIENLQREMHATGNQPFAIPFNDPALAISSASAAATENPTTASLAAVGTSSVDVSSRRFKKSGNPALHLEKFVRRIHALNTSSTRKLLSEQEIDALNEFATQITAHQSNMKAVCTEDGTARTLLWWQILHKLLAEGPASQFFFPGLGIFRVLLLLPTHGSESIVTLKNSCFDALLRATDTEKSSGLSTSQVIILLSVLVNAFANQVASELVMARSANFLSFAFSSIAESTHADVRLLSATVISNFCLALKIEEEIVITTIICGAVETLDRISREQQHSATLQTTIEGVVGGIGRLLRDFEAARNLSLELGLAEVLQRLHGAPAMSSIHPLISEVVALI